MAPNLSRVIIIITMVIFSSAVLLFRKVPKPHKQLVEYTQTLRKASSWLRLVYIPVLLLSMGKKIIPSFMWEGLIILVSSF